MIGARVAVSFMAAFVLMIGCAQKQERTRTQGTGVSVDEPAPTEPPAQASELHRRAKELRELANRMPGRDSKQDRELAAEAFEQASAALAVLGGPSPGGTMRQQMRIIDKTTEFLRTSSADVSPDASIDSGLRSLNGALSRTAERLFRDQPKVQSALDALAQRVHELDSVRGPLHSLVVAQAFDAASGVIDVMAQHMESRAAAAAPAAAPAATQP